MLGIIAALVLGAILLPTAAAFAEGMDWGDIVGAPVEVQTLPLYLGPINVPQVDTSREASDQF